MSALKKIEISVNVKCHNNEGFQMISSQADELPERKDEHRK
jgi:hypothetical protein